MSEAVKAAIRAARQQQRTKASSPTKRDALDSTAASPKLSSGSSSFTRNDFMSEQYDSTSLSAATEDVAFVQTSVEGLLNKACQNGRINLSSRSPALKKLPAELFSFCDDDAPGWFSAPGLRWWERQDLRGLIAANGELEEIDERINAFRALASLDLRNNRLLNLPHSLFQLKNLTSLTISHNKLTSWPDALNALDNLITLDISHNQLVSLWTDQTVEAARDEREQWDKAQQESEHQGIWAGLGRDQPKGRKEKEALALEAQRPRSMPLRALKTLNLGSNKLTNAALGLAATDSGSISWPSQLERLDLSNNAVLSPVVLHVRPNGLTGLPALKELVFAGNGISDEVFQSTGGEVSTSAFEGMQSLSILDLQRCEIDDLDKFEAFFGSRFGAGNDPSASRELVQISDRSKVQSEPGKRRLHVLLGGNPLREELFKQKRGQKPTSTQQSNLPPVGSEQDRGSSSKQSTKEAIAPAAPKPAVVKDAWELEAEAGLITEGQKRLARIQAARKAEADAAAAAAGGQAPNEPSGSSPSPVTAASQPAPVKNSGNKTGLSDWDGEPVLPKYLQHRQVHRGTSDPTVANPDADDAEADPDMSEYGTDADGSGALESNAGSTLANAKLSVKKKEALGQVPCKFFRSNGCSAGAACPFAHTMPGDGHQKAICAYWAKGQCKFGHKCALLHILPGQPVSMDRKNKRAAQQAQNTGTLQDMGQAGTRLDSRGHQRQPSKNMPPSNLPNSSQSPFPHPVPPQHHFSQHAPIPLPLSENLPAEALHGPPGPAPWFPGVPPQAAAALLANFQNGHMIPLNPSRNLMGPPNPSFDMGDVAGMDLPFGIPDDLQQFQPPRGYAQRPLYPPSPFSEDLPTQTNFPHMNAMHMAQANGPPPFFRSLVGDEHVSLAQTNASLHPAAVSSAAISVTPGSSATRPVSVPYARSREEDHAHSMAGSPALASRAFGTSPFSHPAGTSVFYSASQDESDSRAQSEYMRQQIESARSMSRLDDLEARERWSNAARTGRGEDGRPGLHIGQGEHDQNGEEFLPSSLSDLLTPAELERRKRSASQTLSQRPLSFVGYSGLQAQVSGHRQGQLSASAASRFNGTDALSRSPSSVGRWPPGFSNNPGPSATSRSISTGMGGAGSGAEALSSMHHLYGRNQPTPNRYGQGRATAASGINSAEFLSGSASPSLPYQAPQSLPPGLATGISRMHLGSHSSIPAGDDPATSAGNVPRDLSPWASQESGRVPSASRAGMSSGAGQSNSHGLSHLLAYSGGADSFLSTRAAQAHLGSANRHASSTDLLNVAFGNHAAAAAAVEGEGGNQNTRSGYSGVGGYLGLPSSNAYDELGPVAPSSILPHRPSPLSLAAGAGIRRTDSGAYLPSSASGSFVSSSASTSLTAGDAHSHLGPSTRSGAASPAAGGSSNATSSAWGGIAIPNGGNKAGTGPGAGLGRSSAFHSEIGSGNGGGGGVGTSSAEESLSQGGLYGGGLMARHHHYQQSRAQDAAAGGNGGAGASNSPLTLPTSTKEEFDEAIFELE
ncbi:unnamed protein product [Tilletia controversa]|uniref:C3H1-type domain-containing protein n=3 Tax=Tilletia TaxID=13289 RepID=A0A8X7MSF5_9BASI|nr:hypothetical protein CF336_g4780 [Tilletia laevis]KAE8194994.1 hypothetical protein CF328_g4579 [Tilletia controversa]KAE8258881.1 hypothetical protein A4X03_0g4256 [Tilletia caries]KAE8199163.1 hypothetical protein CF335_g4231 [Tilletia laevis]KAE8246633.1 hypothetical protein A4X06_0g4937 [Tilletia controversa]